MFPGQLVERAVAQADDIAVAVRLVPVRGQVGDQVTVAVRGMLPAEFSGSSFQGVAHPPGRVGLGRAGQQFGRESVVPWGDADGELGVSTLVVLGGTTGAGATAPLGPGEGRCQQAGVDQLVEVVGDGRTFDVQGSARLVTGDGLVLRRHVLVELAPRGIVQAAQRFEWVAAHSGIGRRGHGHRLADWSTYLWSGVATTLPGSADDITLMVGAIEIIASLLVAVRSRLGGYVVAAWLGGIIVNLLLVGGHLDIALRDFGLLLGALTLARLAVVFPSAPLLGDAGS